MKHIRLALLILATVLAAAGCRRGAQPSGPAVYKDTQLLIGTTVTITLYGDDEHKLKRAAGAGFAEIERLNAVFSRYDPESELSKLNVKAARGGTFPVSAELAGILDLCLELCRETQDAFDITVGPLSAVWREARESGKTPSDTEIREAMSKTGCARLSVDKKRSAVTFSAPGMSLDLGGIAKGYITESAMRVIEGHGVQSAMINAGGDITASGTKPGGDLWALGIQNPREPDDVLARVLLKDAAVATSGDYQQFFEKNGRRESHIIDPRTGHGAAETISVTVIAPDNTLADTLATALSVLGPEHGFEVLKKNFPQAHALIITPDKKLHYSPGFKKFMAEQYR